ncbi:putative tetratricopeptide-like helical domain superfamily [Helianthus annuus]|uniref:Putative tetratricopeptide-like helical domain-containing protein n=1 Tax=Helianthus annuus TaxID=4232 RepID=A0A251VJF0_HELAN|nr:pentatricopeptide repeat-containing protein At3g02650, mitochondrial [Helianthus annuus]XP_035831206.1 pentatricopeptide repeat-containing protein At3g02650, mitochondrial [Helianthus annuus]KAF5799763.1 putative tetratricopeptide-like helical domain superfamily [Helianthus annuus]
MWRSRLLRFRSSHTRSSQLHSKVHTFQTLTPTQHFRSIPLFPQSNVFRFFSSTSTDSITDVEDSNNAVIPDKNHTFNIGEIWNQGVDEVKNVFETEAFDSENPNPVELNHEVDVEELDRVITLLKSEFNGSIESSLDEMNLNLSEEFVVRVLVSENVSGERLIDFFKWAAAGGSSSSNEQVFSVTTRSLDVLVRAVSAEMKKKVAYKLWDLVKEIGEKGDGVVSTEVLNALISLFSRLGKGMAGYEVFDTFGDFSCVTNADSYYFTIQALCRRSIFDRVGLVCERMVSEGKLPEAAKVGDVIYYLCKGGMVKEARSVYLSAKETQQYPPQPSVNFLISSLCDRKKNDADSVHFALKMLDDIETKKYAIKQFSCVIQALCRVNDIEAAKALLSRMIDNGPPPGNAIFNTIINALSKSGDMTEAINVMRMMENRGLKPDVFAYSVIMSGYAKGGEMEEASKMLTEAKKNHCKLTPVIYHTIIRGYCKLEQFGKAVKLLEEMEEYGVRPNTDEYNKLIQSLCLKAADWVMAEKLMEEMTKKGLHLNGITKSLIRAVKELEEEGKGAKEATVAA